jgi:histidinol dehydrogenase
MLTTLDLRGRGLDVAALLPAPGAPGEDVAEAVRAIIDEVRRDGDVGLRRCSERFDGVVLDEIRLDPSEATRALASIPTELRAALEQAWERIVTYHAHEPSPVRPLDAGGVRVSHRDVPVERAGCYAPGGRARYPSSVLMCAAPARVAGVGQLALCVPPTREGRIDDATLAAAAMAGFDEIYPLGGAQAIAALALGTESVERVDVIVGPGNSYVAEAKRQLSGVVGVASAFAGPSEIVVVADASTPPALAAIDLMVQAEHGPDGMAWLITWDAEVASRIDGALEELVAASPRRGDLESTLASNGVACLVDGPEAAMAVSNLVAPEHLELLVADYDALVEQVAAAGAVFCGIDAPASLGDYAAGPNHILPTNRSARFSSALRAEDFRRHIHVVEVTREGFEALATTVETLATTEGLAAHAESIRMRR